jgi:oligoribonuclease NrnB/cAMP/cGMP phosphodiesterase (DHH superfamily)
MLIKNITHSDMDGVGCSIIMNKLFHDHLGFDESQIVRATYNDLFQNIMNFASFPQEDTILIITDLNVETQFLKKLLDLSNVKKLLYIDHHERSDGRKGLESLKYFEPSRFEYRWRKGVSATKSAYDFSVKHGIQTSKEFEKLINIIDIYDEWHKSDIRFNEALGLNSIYWDIGFDEFYKKFYDGLVWTKEMKEFVAGKFKEQNEYFEEAEKYNQIVEFDKKKVLISFNPKGKYTNLYTLRYDADLFILFDYETKLMRKFSLRSTNDYYDCNAISLKAAKNLKGAQAGGHKATAGISVPIEIGMDELITELLNVIEKI